MSKEKNPILSNGNDDLFLKYRDEKKFNDKSSIKECFRYFTKHK